MLPRDLEGFGNLFVTIIDITGHKSDQAQQIGDDASLQAGPVLVAASVVVVTVLFLLGGYLTEPGAASERYPFACAHYDSSN